MYTGRDELTYNWISRPVMKIGAHVSTPIRISKAIVRGQKIGCEAIRIFGSSPQAWAFKVMPGDQIERF